MSGEFPVGPGGPPPGSTGTSRLDRPRLGLGFATGWDCVLGRGSFQRVPPRRAHSVLEAPKGIRFGPAWFDWGFPTQTDRRKRTPGFQGSVSGLHGARLVRLGIPDSLVIPVIPVKVVIPVLLKPQGGAQGFGLDPGPTPNPGSPLVVFTGQEIMKFIKFFVKIRKP